MSNLRKIFFFSLFLFIGTLLFWGVYNISFKNSDNEGESGILKKKGESQIAENVEKVKNVYDNKISLISDEAVLSPTLSQSGDRIRYFSPGEGSVFEIELDGTGKKKISDSGIKNPSKAIWSQDKSKIILKSLNGADNPSFYIFNVVAQKAEKIEKQIDEVSWQINADRIFYKYYNSATEEKILDVSDLNGGNWKEITKIPYRYVSLAQIPKTGLLSFWNSGKSDEKTIFEYVPIAGGEKKTIFSEKFGADYLWSESGDYVLASYISSEEEGKLKLGVMSYTGEEFKNLDMPTFVSKCIWSKDDHAVFLAVPSGIEAGTKLPEDYKNGKIKTVDTFWKVDTITGEKTRLVEVKDIKEEFDAQNLFLNSDESVLFFVNMKDQKLYRINL